MIKVLLFDLDYTLLDYEVSAEEFDSKTLEIAAERFAHLMPPEEFGRRLWEAVWAAKRNIDPSQTNMDVILEEFCRRVGYPQEISKPLFDEFWAKDFDRLRIYSRVKPEARRIMEKLFAQGYEIVIATEPTRALAGQLQRLEWAEVGDFNYKLVTAPENMHFCKPHTEYYEEILDKIGHRAEECMMIGDDIKHDIEPAAKLGMKTFLVIAKAMSAEEATVATDFSGTLADFERFIDEGKLQDL
jgi:HAD superfamily hydrolase (TIGR01549 family)